MRKLFEKIRGSWINSFLFSCLLVSIFIAIFYLVNLDWKPAPKISDTGKITVAVDFDAEIKNRLGATGIAAESYSQWAARYGLNSSNNGLDQDPDGDGLSNYLEYVHATNPMNPDTDGDGYTDQQEISAGYDPTSAEGNPKLAVTLSIDKLGIEAPMIWSTSQNENDMLKDLENGISHYAGTASPGQNGNMVVSGHSSNYIWAKGNYNHIFKDLNNLQNGDIVTVRAAQKNGRIITYQYKITGKYVDAPDDARIFENTDNPTITLSTCWPLGTNFKRLVLKGEMVK